MKVCVINGSPKGNYSVTLQTSLFLEKKFKEFEFEVINVGQQIRVIEKDLNSVVMKIKESDLIILSYPVYTFVAPSQLHRFIELLKDNNIDLENKFVTQISTSKHFYDMTAHKYVEENCYDLKMKYIKGLSLDMEDLLSEDKQQEIVNYFEFVLSSIKNDLYEIAPKKKIKEIPVYEQSFIEVEKKADFEAVMVADIKEDDTNLINMIEDFKKVFPYKIRVVNIREFPFSGGCLGCFNCAASGKCIYKDGFDSFLRENIQTGNAIIIAFSIKDHSMGARFKMYDDRPFCNGHRTVTEGMPFAYIINGDYEVEHNLKTIVEARAEVGGNYLAGVGYDKETLMATSKKLAYAIENKITFPRNFYGVGGMKIFRDLIWIMRGIMKADHDYYKKHGVYDFPQKKRATMMLMCLLGSMMRNPKIKAKMGNKFNEGMVAPYKKVLDKLE
jgi:multimeric flavodoxin WrbA